MSEIDPPTARRPVQVLVDTKRFITVEEPRPPRGKRDFYAGDDKGFVRHKTRMRGRLLDIAEAMRSRGDPLGFIRVAMRDDALGKSYRPLGTLFRPAHGFAFVGTDRIGEMLFQATPGRLNELASIIDLRAEEMLRMVENEKTGQLEPRPSAYRAELGAISEIELHGSAERVSFSAEEAVHWFEQDGVIGNYIVELFRPHPGLARDAVRASVESFKRSLLQLPSGVRVRDFSAGAKSSELRVAGSPMVAMAIDLLADSRVKDVNHSLLGDAPPPRGQPRVERLPLFRPSPERSENPSHHAALLEALAEQALVRSVDLAPIMESAPAGVGTTFRGARITPPTAGSSYPVVGVIDGGIKELKDLEQWCSGRAGLTAPEHRDTGHGTFIAGLIAAGSQLNSHLSLLLESGCKFYDIDIFPRKELRAQYFGGDLDYFFDLLDEAIRTAKNAHGARVFNLSFGVRTAGPRSGYSAVADRLDRLARDLDVILVVSAGNLPRGKSRPPWQKSAVSTVAMLAGYGGEQQISAPAEHFLGLTVGAINPPGIIGHEAELPTTYSRRGPGVGGARKPDLAHFGGAEPTALTGNRTGLASLTPTGDCEEQCGTSFAAPNAAATLATVDHRLGQQASRETLLALAIHRAKRCDALRHPTLRHVAREFVGFGLAPPADLLLTDEENAITLAFSEKLMPRRRLEFDFAWPECLVDSSGACRGTVDLTLAFTPPIDGDHKDEAMRIQLDAHLYQETVDPATGDLTWDSRLTQDGSGVPQGLPKTERYMLMAGLKWSPVKRYHVNMPRGRGKRSNWRLAVTSLSRAGAEHPLEGVPFTLLMTISDPKSGAPVHDELRSQLQNQGLTLTDIMVAHRVRAR